MDDKQRRKRYVLRCQFNKLIAPMVIRPIDDRTRYAQSVVADLRPLGLRYVGVGDGRIR